MRFSDDERARLKALVEGVEWAPTGTTRVEVVSKETTA
jgi:hypothetical protein